MRGTRSTDTLVFPNTAEVGPFTSQICEIYEVEPMDYFMERGFSGVVGLNSPPRAPTLCADPVW